MWEEFLKKNCTKLMIVSFIVTLIAVAIVGNFYFKTGSFFDRDISLKGGSSATVYADNINILNLEKDLNEKIGLKISVLKLMDVGGEKQIGAVIESTETGISDKLKTNIEDSLDIKLTKDNFSIEEVGSSLGEGFYRDLLKAVVIAFVLMSLVVFIAFRSFIPSMAVILSAFTDMIVPLAVIDLLKIEMTTAGIAAILLVIGYSVDTDILLTVKVLKRRDGGNVYERIVDSAKTGLTMTATTFVALALGYFVTNSAALKQMFMIIDIALLADIVSTYFMNAGILIWYTKRKGKNEERLWA